MFNSFFSHIYFEDGAADFALGQQLLDRFPKAEKIKIRNYKDIFNRPRQDWQLQAKTRKLILAIKRDDFLYTNSDLVPSFDQPNSYYCSQVLNCVYNCSYCYLQGLYPSANIVVFVNSEDFFEATSKALQQLKSVYLCISYDTDLLGFENLFNLNRRWIEYANVNKNILIETRTKSANYSVISDMAPIKNFILAWTLSPAEVQSEKEKLTASLEKRLQAINSAINDGWNVRICFDPILAIKDWKDIYANFIKLISERLDLNRVYDFSLGSFRINYDFLKIMRKQERFDSLIHYPYEVSDAVAGYSQQLEQELREHVHSMLTNFNQKISSATAHK